MAPFLWVFLALTTFSVGISAYTEENLGLQKAFNDSKGKNYEEIYQRAKIRLDMENVENVTNQLINLTDPELVVASPNNCKDIHQTSGIPWVVNNSAMMFASSSAYVTVNGTVDLEGGVTFSLWVSRFNTTSQCSILKLKVGDSSEFQLLRKNQTDEEMDDHYVLTHSNKPLLPFSLQKKWDWNMISVTVNETKICLFENGVNLDDHSGEFGANCVNGTITSQTDTSVELSLNYGSNGCENVSVDEVSFWSEALEMSDLMALRIQPFNSSCELEFTPYDFNETIEVFKDSSPQEASDILDDIKDDINEESPNSLEEVEFLTDILTLTVSKGLLNDTSLDASTQKQNREAYVYIANVIVKTANGNDEIADEIDMNSLVDQFEGTLGDVYFYSDITNESISTELIDLNYIQFNSEHKDLDKLYQVPNTNVKLSIPKENFKGDEQEMVVILFNEAVGDLLDLTEETEMETFLTNMLSLQLPETENEKLTKAITITFPVTKAAIEKASKNATAKEVLTPTCKYLHFDTSTWSTYGVSTSLADGSVEEVKPEGLKANCVVTHLTNFAVLMSRQELAENATLSTLSYILLTISIICLVITFVVLMCLREIANTQRIQILKHFIFALMMAQLLFVSTSGLPDRILCIIAAFLLHYFWLAAFTWMLVQGVQLYTKVRRLVGGNIKQIFYVLFAWGFPLPIALGPLIINLSSNAELRTCWLPPDLIWFFAVPVILVFTVNLLVTILVMKTFLTVKVNKDKTDAEKLKSSMRAVIVMVPVLGLTWVFGFLLLIDPTMELFQYLFVILNALQGVFVFLVHLVLNEDVRSAVLKRRNKVAASAENTIFTKLPRNKNSEHSGGITTDTSKAPLPSDSTNM